jgi:hypothetical protein
LYAISGFISIITSKTRKNNRYNMGCGSSKNDTGRPPEAERPPTPPEPDSHARTMMLAAWQVRCDFWLESACLLV